MGAESTNAETMLAYVRAQLGKLYKLGSHGPAKFDCSGLTMEMVKLMGLKWTHSSNSQWYNNIKANGDFSEYGDIDTLPPDKFAVIFHYGKRTNGQMGMVHVGVYDGVTHHSIQAGGYGKKVYVDGKKTSTVSEDPLDKRRWTKWAHIKGQDEEGGTYVATVSAVRNGSTGADVTKLQENLVALGYNIAVDGIFGAKTEAALKEYQEAYGLETDGVCGSITWASIDAAVSALGEGTVTDVPLTLEQRVAALELKVAALESK